MQHKQHINPVKYFEQKLLMIHVLDGQRRFRQNKLYILIFKAFFSELFLNNSNHSDATRNQSNYQEIRNINKSENFQRKEK